ncbi:integrase domain-containing protein [Marinobacter salexigens]|uniref:Integrase domain-containing protein n=1 Tax=Marinobacter salexigens TaxID=1925763 RepID=A0ABS6A7W0_9GAMM|nr:integrase domain-containing protein [Marinobacter salexigens]MBU2874168.1 integrase domain-containing protein [Marinobacter salexigens]
MRGNNLGLKTRDMAKAGRFAMNREVADGNASFSTAATIGDRFNLFSKFAKDRGLRRLEEITVNLVTDYGQALARQVETGDLSAAYAQNLVSAVNTVMQAATRGSWASVSPTKTCKIPQRCHVRENTPASIDRGLVDMAMAAMSERGRAITSLARDLGLRSKESSLIDAKAAFMEAKKSEKVTIVHGTKGGRKREVPINNEQQLASLEHASHIQGEARSLVPENQTWSQFCEGDLRDIREILQAHGMTGLHDLRAGYACDLYENITGELPPLSGGKASKAVDMAARKVIAVELGHGRTDVLSSYIGGRP